MKKKFQTEQESFWSGTFGDEYISRNNEENSMGGQILLFSQKYLQKPEA